MSRKKKWDGLCRAGKHGLDHEGQHCDQCFPPPPPYVCTTKVDPLMMKCVVMEADRLRARAAKDLRDLAEAMVKMAEGLERGGLDSYTNSLSRPSFDSVMRAFADYESIDVQQQTLRIVLGVSAHGREPLEENPAIKDARTEQGMWRKGPEGT